MSRLDLVLQVGANHRRAPQRAAATGAAQVEFIGNGEAVLMVTAPEFEKGIAIPMTQDQAFSYPDFDEWDYKALRLQETPGTDHTVERHPHDPNANREKDGYTVEGTSLFAPGVVFRWRVRPTGRLLLKKYSIYVLRRTGAAGSSSAAAQV